MNNLQAGQSASELRDDRTHCGCLQLRWPASSRSKSSPQPA